MLPRRYTVTLGLLRIVVMITQYLTNGNNNFDRVGSGKFFYFTKNDRWKKQNNNHQPHDFMSFDVSQYWWILKKKSSLTIFTVQLLQGKMAIFVWSGVAKFLNAYLVGSGVQNSFNHAGHHEFEFEIYILIILIH